MGECFVLVAWVLILNASAIARVRGGRLEKCALEQKVVRFLMILISHGSLFQSLEPVPQKVLSPAQMSFTLILESSIV